MQLLSIILSAIHLWQSGGVFNGRVETTASLSGVPIADFSDYTYTWYDGEDITSDPVLTSTSADGDILYGLDAGRYTVILERNATSCISDPLTVEIFDVTLLPVIDITERPSTNCIGGTPNGELAARVDEAGTFVLNGYSFSWFEGVDTSPAGIPVSNISGTHNELAQQLTGGNTYSVLVINDTSGCSSTESHILTDDSQLPVVALSKTDNTICDISLPSVNAFNGSSTPRMSRTGGSAVSDFTNYTFEWFDGPGVTDPVLTNTSPDGSVLEEIPGGFYTARVRNDILGCTSDPFTIEVMDVLDIPAITLNETPATNCEPSLANGSATATVGGSVTGFIFKWVEGINVNDPEWSPVDGIANETARQLSGGNTYTVRVTNEITGCFNTQGLVISDSSALPVVDLAQVPNTICDPAIAGVNFNGQINGNTLYQGIPVVDFSDYSFRLFEGNDTTGLVLNTITAGPADFTALENGFYTVRAYDLVLGCYSDPASIEVLEDFTLPAIDVIEVSATNCDPSLPNGELSASVLGTTIGYGFKWVSGTDTSGPALSTDAGVTDLSAGNTYTVMVTIDSTGCAGEVSRILGDSSELPLIALVQTPNAICDPVVAGVPYNGTVSGTTDYRGSAVSDYSDYYFNLFEGSDTTGTLHGTVSAAALNFIELQDGIYTSRAYNTALGCYSDPVTIEVLDDFIFPVINLTERAATNCDPAIPNGSVTADAGGTTAGHLFKWVSGLNTDDPEWSFVSGTVSETAESLTAGDTYTVKVTASVSGCFETESILLSDSSELPLIALVQTPNAICDPVVAGVPYNGTVSGTTDYRGSAVSDYSDYYFNLFEGSDTTGTLHGTVSAAALNFIELQDGIYTSRAYNTALGCYSDPVTIEVLDDFIFPVINLTERAATNCDPAIPNGSVTADAGGTTAGHLFKWVSGLNTDDPEWSFVSGTVSETAESLTAGDTYTVKVTASVSGCFETESILLSDSSELPLIALVQTPNAICDPVVAGVPYNGTVSGTTDYRGSAVSDYSDYYFNLFEGSDTTGTLHGTVSAAALNFIELQDGIYTSRAYNTALGCYSDPVTIEVLDDFIFPVINLTERAATNCDPAIPNGAVTADAGGTTAGHLFKWVSGLNTDDPEWSFVSGTVSETAESLTAGDTYTVKVTASVSGCFETESILLSDSSELPLIALVQTPNAICDPVVAGVPYNGTVSGTTDYRGSAVSDYSDYYFNLFEGSDTTGTLHGTVSAAALNFIELQDGIYTSRAYNTALGCYSDPVTIEVLDDFIFPVINLTERAATNCDPSLPNGSLTATDAGVTAGRTFTWVEGLDLSVPPWSSVSGSANETAENLSSGNIYTVQVTIQTSGCFETSARMLSDSSEVPILSLVQTPNTICDETIAGAFDGTITGSMTYYGSPVSDFSPYIFNLFEGSDSTGVILNTAAGIQPDFFELQHGDYTARAYDFATGCFSDPVTIAVADNTVQPAILITREPNSSCDDAQPNGNIQAFVDAIGNTAGHNFTWYNGSTTTSGNETVTVGSMGEIISLSGNMNYTIEVTSLTTGCVNTLTTFLNRIIPTFDLSLTVTDIVDCNNPGSILATVDSSGTVLMNDLEYVNYEFYWYRGDVVDAGNELPTITRNLTEISPGVDLYSEDYTVYAVNTYTHCLSNDVTGFVAAPAPLFTIESEINFYPSDCNTSEGALTAWVDNGGSRDYNNYSFYWYDGRNINPGSNFYTDPPVEFTGDSLDINLPDGSLTYIGMPFAPPRNRNEGRALNL
jgi:hypothetical protein